MNSSNPALQSLNFVFYFLFQFVLAQHFVLFGVAFCFMYVGWLLQLPYTTPRLLLMFLGFVMGLGVDVFYDTLGINAFACVLIMYIRPYWISTVGVDEYNAPDRPGVKEMGPRWFTFYALPLVLLHHLLVFLLEAFHFNMLGMTLLKAGTSSLYTLVVVMLLMGLSRFNLRTV